MSDIRNDFMNESRPLAEALVDYAIKAGKPYGITDAKIEISGQESQENELENGVLVKSFSGTRHDVEVTLYAGNRVLSFCKNTLDKETLCDTMLQNMQVIHLVPENAKNRLLEESKVYKGPVVDLDLYDFAQVEQEALITYARQIEAAVKAHPGIKTIESVSASKSTTQSLVLATNGIDSYVAKTMYSAGASVIAEDKNGMEGDGEFVMSRHFSDLGNAQVIGKMAAENTVARLGATLPATGDMPVILNHDAAESFFDSVYSAINGTLVYREATFMKDKIGQQVMSRGVTLVDTPDIKRGLSSGQIDAAGQEMKEITFIEDGVLKGFNLTLLQARQLNLEPIGRQGSEDRNTTTNSRILPGSQTPEELIREMQNGIYVLGFHGGQADVNTGVFSRQAHGLLIEDGKITNKAVAGFVVSGNLKDMFMSVALANDTPTLPSTKHRLAAPTTRIAKVTIAGQ